MGGTGRHWGAGRERKREEKRRGREREREASTKEAGLSAFCMLLFIGVVIYSMNVIAPLK